VVSRIAQTCRAAAIEMPRPTVRKWCEHGYNVAFEKTKKDVGAYFRNEKAHFKRQEDMQNGVAPEEPKKTEPAAKRQKLR
jgi:hypothetical protein